jgi:glycosyltransferase involved in cell wall biosynthesis
MKILHLVTRSEVGGAQSVVANLAAELHAVGHQVAIASGPEGNGEAWKHLDAGIELLVVPGLVRDVSPVNEVRALGSISALYRRYRPDIVHLHTSKAGFLGRMAPGIPRHRIVYTMHGYFQLRDINRKFLAVDKILQGQCGSIVAVSHNDERLMRADGYTVACVPNGIPDLLASPVPDGDLAGRIERLRARGLPIIMLIARDAVFKRIDLARDVARALDGKALVVWIGGDPRPNHDPAGFIALGSAMHAARYLRLADIYLQPSDHEGLSMSLLEGLCSGLPCVASSVGGNIETLGGDPAMVADDGSAGPIRADAGILVPNKAGIMADEMARLVADASLRRVLGQKARASWARDYSSATMAARYVNIYQALLRA